MKPPPNRLRLIAVAVSSVLLTAGLVRAASDAWRQKLDAASKAAEAQRKTLGLDGPDDEDALSQKYPSPEVQFGNGVTQYEGAFATLCPGETGRLFIPGKFLEGTTFVVKSDDVQVTGEKLTPKGWEATVTAPRDWVWEPVKVIIASPVSFASVTVNALLVRCSMRFKLALDSGQTLEATLGWDKKARALVGNGAWKPGGTVKLEVDSSQRFALKRAFTETERLKQIEKADAVSESPALLAANARRDKAEEVLETCTKAKGRCEAERNTVAQEEAAAEALRRSMVGALTVGCDRMDLKLGRGTAEGRAEECFDGRDHTVKGTFSSP